MNTAGLLPYQVPHAERLIQTLLRRGSALDASDTGTGKTFVALAICRELGIVPLVLGPKNSRVTWENAAELLKVDIEWANYEMIRGRRKLRGGKQIDHVKLEKDPTDPFMFIATATLQGKPVLKIKNSWERLTNIFNFPSTIPWLEVGNFSFDTPISVLQTYISESNWITEHKYGSGSYVKWKNYYEMMIFDEVHRCGGSTTLQSKLLIAGKRQAKLILTLSATAADDPRQMKALGFALGLHTLNNPKSGFRAWLWRHGCQEGDYGMKFTENNIERRKVFEKLHSEIFPICGARMRKSEIPGFPRSQIEVKLLYDESGKAVKLAGDARKKFEQHRARGILATTALEETLRERQALEMLMTPDTIDLVLDLMPHFRVVIFVNFTDTLDELTNGLSKKLGSENVGWIKGSQTGTSGEQQRNEFIKRFQVNQLPVLICNVQAGGEAVSLHDPTGQVERATLIYPMDSGRRMKQVLGRVDRINGANSVQYFLYFKGTVQEEIAKRVMERKENLELLNGEDLS